MWGGLFRNVGYVQRSLTEQGSDTHDRPSTLYLARAVQVMDRGTYHCVHVSRKGGHVSRKGAKTQRRKGTGAQGRTGDARRAGKCGAVCLER